MNLVDSTCTTFYMILDRRSGAYMPDLKQSTRGFWNNTGANFVDRSTSFKPRLFKTHLSAQCALNAYCAGVWKPNTIQHTPATLHHFAPSGVQVSYYPPKPDHTKARPKADYEIVKATLTWERTP
jgi:hypothetical protein